MIITVMNAILSNCVDKPEKVRTSTPLKSWLFQASLCNCLKIAFITAMIIAYLISKSAVQYMKHFIYHFSTYTFRLWPRTPRIEKTHFFLQYGLSWRYVANFAWWVASNTSRAKQRPVVLLFVFFTKFTQSNSIFNRSYSKSFYFLVTHRLNYRRNDYFSSKHCSQHFKVLLRQDVIHFFALKKAIHRKVWEPGDHHNEPSSSNIRSLTTTTLVCF